MKLLALLCTLPCIALLSASANPSPAVSSLPSDPPSGDVGCPYSRSSTETFDKCYFFGCELPCDPLTEAEVLAVIKVDLEKELKVGWKCGNCELPDDGEKQCKKEVVVTITSNSTFDPLRGPGHVSAEDLHKLSEKMLDNFGIDCPVVDHNGGALPATGGQYRWAMVQLTGDYSATQKCNNTCDD